MAASGIYLKGLRETVRSLERFGVEAEDLKAAFFKIGNAVADEAKTLAPKQSGALAASIRPSKTKNKSVIRAGSARVPYAGVLEYGGYNNIEPHNFMRGAIENKQDDTVRTLDEEFAALIAKYGLR